MSGYNQFMIQVAWVRGRPDQIFFKYVIMKTFSSQIYFFEIPFYLDLLN